MKGKVEQGRRKGEGSEHRGRREAGHGIRSPGEHALSGKQEGRYRRPLGRGK